MNLKQMHDNMIQEIRNEMAHIGQTLEAIESDDGANMVIRSNRGRFDIAYYVKSETTYGYSVVNGRAL